MKAREKQDQKSIYASCRDGFPTGSRRVSMAAKKKENNVFGEKKLGREKKRGVKKIKNAHVMTSLSTFLYKKR